MEFRILNFLAIICSALKLLIFLILATRFMGSPPCPQSTGKEDRLMNKFIYIIIKNIKDFLFRETRIFLILITGLIISSFALNYLYSYSFAQREYIYVISICVFAGVI